MMRYGKSRHTGRMVPVAELKIVKGGRRAKVARIEVMPCTGDHRVR
jgi:hypothetical protein